MKLIAPFLNDPQRDLNIREYARLMRIASMTARKYLALLAGQKLLTRRKERNLVLHKADEESSAYRDAKLHHNIRKIRESGLLAHVKRELHEPLAIYLFGSYAKSENVPRSDIDLFIVTHTKMPVDTKLFEQRLRAPVQLFVHTPADIQRLKKTNPHLLNNVINGTRLDGFWEIL